MHKHAAFALAHPVFDPVTQILSGHRFAVGRISAVLTANIGME